MNIEDSIGDFIVAAVYILVLAALILFPVVIVLIGWVHFREQSRRLIEMDTKSNEIDGL